MKKTDIIFIKVADNKTKLLRICETVQRHFLLKQKVQITVPTTKAAQYLDELLWKTPEDGFLPHKIVSKNSDEPIAITLTTHNFTKAQVLFNLQTDASATYDEYEVVYELYDETHPTKTEQSLKRQQAYPYFRM